MRSIAFLLAALALPAVHAQPTDVYKVELTMRDATDASAKSGRHYTILVDIRGAGTFKIGNREPVASGSFMPGTGGTGVNPLVNTQYTYIDTGVNIECRLEPADAKLQLRADIDISSVMQQKTAVPNPAIGQLKLAVNALVVPGKRTVIASVDDPVTNRKFDVEALVTKAE
ncbi:MAG TPA: hypothetical protein VGS58_19615 [Candidatus Sulfopaludibacter sp.]|nr:hypothetical protein [Candidatus Sulfopaludibacter sp.]